MNNSAASARPLVVLLGASGFVGCALLGQLADQPLRIRAVARGPIVLPPSPVAELETRQADLLDPEALGAAIADADVVIHLVAYSAAGTNWRSATSSPEAREVNVGLMQELVKALRDAKTSTPPVVLFASTVQANAADEHDATPTLSAYAAQKSEAERVLNDATAEGIARGIIVRLPNVFGESAPGGPTSRSVVAVMANKALAGESITIWHDGTIQRNMLHVIDAARALASALEHAEELVGTTTVVSADRAEPVSDIFTAIARGVARETGTEPVPVLPVPPPEHSEAHDFRDDDFDSSAFREITGWRPRLSLWEGLDRTVAAMVSERRRARSA